MRFSLGTLMLVVLWLASMALVWFQWNAWVLVRSTTCSQPGSRELNYFELHNRISSDKRRKIEFRYADHSQDCVVIVDFEDSGNRILWQRDGNISDARFIDNDTLWIDDYLNNLTFHRRHPEWWWGHFYRPEVWCAIQFSGVLLWRFFNWIRRAKASA